MKLTDLFSKADPVPRRPDTPACVPAGQTHSEFVMLAAIHDFQFARKQGDPVLAMEQEHAAMVNLCHAWLVQAVKGEPLPPERALELYRQALRAMEV